MSATPRKRSIHVEDDLPSFDDPTEMVNAVISTLQKPDDETNVSMTYSNDKNLATEVQAYAKIAGQNWTFYVKSLAVTIGRNTDNQNGSSGTVDIDLGPAKVVSRQHASIIYNLDLRCWELKVLGRNGARIDGQKTPIGGSSASPLHSGAILDIGGTQMMFILPDSPPNILQKVLAQCLAKYKKSKKFSSNYPQNSIPNNGSQVKSFQMFDKAQLTQSPSSASATSLQNNLDQDLSKEDAKDIKPPYSYATMITQSILSNGEGVMSLSEIYNWISSHYAYYKYSKTGWQNSIRHNLSLNKAFEKVPRRPNEPGKGMKWRISESYKEDFLNKIQSGSLLKTRRGSSVSRQLQLHLATYLQLPESQRYINKEEIQDFDHQRNSSLPKFGQLIQYSNGPSNLPQANPLSYISNQPGNGYFNPPRSYGFQHPQSQLMYGNPLIQQQQQQQQQPQSQPQSQPQPQPQPQPQQQQQQQHQPQQHQQQQQPASQQLLGSLGGNKPELSSPIRQLGELNGATPKLPKVVGNHLFNLPPPPPAPNHHMGNSAPQAHHPRSNSLITQVNESNQNYSSGNNTHTSESGNSNSTAPSTNSDMVMGFTSPKKIIPLEAFTPERGSKPSGSSKLNVPGGVNTNQSSPAFWNFVQFSTPNGQTPLRKNSDELNDHGSPTLSRKVHSKDDITKGSPLRLQSEDKEADSSSIEISRERSELKNGEVAS
ncbi:uncharacterized protein PRCAT00003058001 [Priceomyces carsonii]|uniref:uncharacterized protein n=1 Tax=Priceomyces carsonii TaxID=28549 RepID=UPI002EDB0B34|nr:unnamed protein product [Priceomyces carsonii]